MTMTALNALTVFVMLCMVLLVAGTIADNWPSRDRVEAWLDRYHWRMTRIWADAAEENRDFGPEAEPSILKRGARAWDLYWRIDRALRFVRIAYPHPSQCESCGRICDTSHMTIHDGQWEVCPTCENESTRTRTVFWIMRDLANRY
jgi:hypothetical protein